MSSIKFLLNSSTQYCLLNGNSMKYRQVPILIRLPSPVLWLNKVVPLLILVALRKLLLVRKNKTSSSLIFTFHSFSTPSLLSTWISSFTTPLSTSSKILIQLYIISCFFSLFFAFVIFYFLESFLKHLGGKLVWGYYKLLDRFILEDFQILKDV